MRNAKQELLYYIELRNVEIKAASISFDVPEQDKLTCIVLPCNHTPEQWETFLTALDFEYDAGYGHQYIYGTIWHTDGTWSTREEYDGSEWWQRHVMPPIPEHLA